MEDQFHHVPLCLMPGIDRRKIPQPYRRFDLRPFPSTLANSVEHGLEGKQE